MSEIHISCNDQVLKITEAPIIASGGVNETKVVFSFCEKWNGFEKTAVFYVDEDNPFHKTLNENDTCSLPWEVYTDSGTFYITVFGVKGSTTRTASVVKYKVSKGVVKGKTTPSDPTPDVYAQIMALLNDSKNAVVYTEQTLTDSQKEQARRNIGTTSQSEVDYLHSRLPSGELVFPDMKTGDAHTIYAEKGELIVKTHGGENKSARILTEADSLFLTEQELTNEEKDRARRNIGAAPQGNVDAVAARLLDDMLTLIDKKNNDDMLLYAESGNLYMQNKDKNKKATFLTNEDEQSIIEASKSESVLHTAQALSDSQKAQARENIGAAACDQGAILLHEQRGFPNGGKYVLSIRDGGLRLNSYNEESGKWTAPLKKILTNNDMPGIVEDVIAALPIYSGEVEEV